MYDLVVLSLPLAITKVMCVYCEHALERLKDEKGHWVSIE